MILLNRPLHPLVHAIDGEVLKALCMPCLKLLQDWFAVYASLSN